MRAERCGSRRVVTFTVQVHAAKSYRDHSKVLLRDLLTFHLPDQLISLHRVPSTCPHLGQLNARRLDPSTNRHQVR